MVRKSNIFYRLTQENENATTELLCNLLRRKLLRDITLEFLGVPKNVYETISIDHVSTQKTIDNDARPDITIENDDCLYLIENKIRTDRKLEESQKTTYPKYVKKSKKTYCRYIFIIPKEYEYESEIEAVKTSYPSLFISKIFWEDLLKLYQDKEIGNEMPIVKETIDYFNDVIVKETVSTTKLNIKEVVIMYNVKDLYDTLSLVDKIVKLVEIVSEKICQKLGSDFEIDTTMRTLNEQGKYIKYKNVKRIFLGLNPVLWEKQNGDYVYSVALDVKCLELSDIDANIYESDNEWIYIKIDRKIFTDDDQEDKLIDTVVDIINDVFIKNLKS
jgi:hypothetical protein